MNSINFFSGDKFPMYREALDKMQDMIKLVAGLANMGGKNFILSGCEIDNDGKVNDGVLVVKGEVIPLKGAVLNDITTAKITIKETRQDVNAFNVVYPETYINREAQFANNGEYNWDEFEAIKSNAELQKAIQDIRGDQPGTIKLWAGFASQIQEDYKICDGSPLSIEAYPELYKNIGLTYGGDGQNYFNLPKSSGLFLVGANETDYKLGTTGGAETVKLTKGQMPKHRHAYTDDTNAQGKYPQIEDGFPMSISGVANVKSSAESSGWGTAYNTEEQGGDEAHENRPPFLAVYLIIKVR